MYFVTNSFINQRSKQLPLAVATPLFSIDITRTIGPSASPDYSWAGQFLFAAEDRDAGTSDTQIRFGIVQVAVAYNSATLAWNTIAQLLIGGTSAATAGVLNTAFAWTTLGLIATLNITPTVTVVAPPNVNLTYFLLYSSHPLAVTYL